MSHMPKSYINRPYLKKNKKLPRNVLGVKIFDNRNFFQLQNMMLELILYKNYSTTDVYQLKFILKTKDKLMLKRFSLTKTFAVN